MPVAPESPLIVAVHGLVALRIDPMVGFPAIGVGQNNKLVENGMLGAAGSIGITFKLTVKTCGVVVLFVKVIVGFCALAEDITEVVFTP
jgi:hypothetical protein